MTYRRSRHCCFLRALPATLAVASAFALGVTPARAQQAPLLPSPPPVALASPPGPAAPVAATAKPVAPGKISVTTPKGGKYTLYTVLPAGRLGSLVDSGAGSYTVDKAAQSFAVLNAGTGTVALYPVAAGGAAKLTVAPADFTRVRFVKVTVASSGGASANRRGAAVSVTDAAGQTTEQPVSGAESEELLFEHIPVGRASVSAGWAEASGTRRRVAKTVFIAPVKNGGPFAVSLDLGPAVAAPVGGAAPGMGATGGAQFPTAAPLPDTPKNNSWIAGVVGMAALAALGFYGMRYAKGRGLTVQDGLQKLGVEMPQDAPGLNAAAGLKPVAPVAPPLPSLSDLPAAGPATRGGVGSAGVAASPPGATVTTGPPRLAGVGGPVAGETFPLDSQTPFTVGRDAANVLALAQDNTVSRRHARFAALPGGNGWSVTDDGSSNGVYVNGQRITAPQTLQPGDEIQVGGARFRFEGGAK